MALEDIVRGRDYVPGLSEQILAIIHENPQLHKEYASALFGNPQASAGHVSSAHTAAGGYTLMRGEGSPNNSQQRPPFNMSTDSGLGLGSSSASGANTAAPNVTGFFAAAGTFKDAAAGAPSKPAAAGASANPVWPAAAGAPIVGSSQGTSSHEKAPNDQVRPSYAQTVVGINPLYEDFQARFGSSHLPSNPVLTPTGKGQSDSYLGGHLDKVKNPVDSGFDPSNVESQDRDSSNPLPTPKAQVNRGRIYCNLDVLHSWQVKLESKAVVGSCYGPRPPVEQLRAWMNINWGNKGIKVPHVQYLPNGYFLFMFEEAAQAQFVISHGT